VSDMAVIGAAPFYQAESHIVKDGVWPLKNMSVARNKIRWIVISPPMFLSRHLVSDRYICIFRVTDAGDCLASPLWYEYDVLRPKWSRTNLNGINNCEWNYRVKSCHFSSQVLMGFRGSGQCLWSRTNMNLKCRFPTFKFALKLHPYGSQQHIT
jgi:hypothetical protein